MESRLWHCHDFYCPLIAIRHANAPIQNLLHTSMINALINHPKAKEEPPGGK